ncbi:Peptidase C48, SUMO/Sentrin/Ubl1 [Carpediemonas membranifera]|uniref:Peptidase C48, SUMO/Sentrin/Ubl1 n=1 Tax=Carpediemonas membranifera TaxID=201153 RepID=A0A8J6B877_9EUKA|nr:Peptidase C48, SUMO/Sentrin/Ubl1 [Carpediemonas membranifera]|eukprot:KAG9396274.1 Peptidase C48, SUMO/Sentrin/Ubl1 [Carpediemonas membranifera]
MGKKDDTGIYYASHNVLSQYASFLDLDESLYSPVIRSYEDAFQIIEARSLTPRIDGITAAVQAMYSAHPSVAPSSHGPICKYPPNDAKSCVTITQPDMHRLKSGGELNDSIIEFYLKYITANTPVTSRLRVHVFSTYFFTRLRRTPDLSSSFDYDAVKRWTKDVDIFDNHLLVIPVHQAHHWSLILVVRPGDVGSGRRAMNPRPDDNSSFFGPCILYLDSLGGTKRRGIQLIRRYLKEEWTVRRPGEDADFADTYYFPDIAISNMPKQLNVTDCGLFVLLFAHYFIQFRCPEINIAKSAWVSPRDREKAITEAQWSKWFSPLIEPYWARAVFSNAVLSLTPDYLESYAAKAEAGVGVGDSSDSDIEMEPPVSPASPVSPPYVLPRSPQSGQMHPTPMMRTTPGNARRWLDMSGSKGGSPVGPGRGVAEIFGGMALRDTSSVASYATPLLPPSVPEECGSDEIRTLGAADRARMDDILHRTEMEAAIEVSSDDTGSSDIEGMSSRLKTLKRVHPPKARVGPGRGDGTMSAEDLFAEVSPSSPMPRVPSFTKSRLPIDYRHSKTGKPTLVPPQRKDQLKRANKPRGSPGRVQEQPTRKRKPATSRLVLDPEPEEVDVSDPSSSEAGKTPTPPRNRVRLSRFTPVPSFSPLDHHLRLGMVRPGATPRTGSGAVKSNREREREQVARRETQQTSVTPGVTSARADRRGKWEEVPENATRTPQGRKSAYSSLVADTPGMY